MLRDVFASDQLPNFISRPCAIVANTDPSNKPGQHWCAFYIDKNGYGFYFNSFGLPPTGYHLKFIQKNSKSWRYNSTILQDFNSTVCGHYCLVYLYLKINDVSTRSFLSLFDSNLINNDSCIRLLYDCYFEKINLLTLAFDLFNIVESYNVE